jgi:glycosyltransferase involved in cell wall biosynthesis
MPIYLDVQGAQSRDSGHRGIGRYVLELAGAIERSEHAGEIAGYVTNPDLPVPAALAAVVPAGRLVSSADVDFQPGDVFHLTSPFEDVPLDRVWPPSARADGVKLAVTVYDLIPLIYPEHYLSDAAYHARYKNRVELIRLADRIFAISAATARDAVAMLSLPGEAVTVTGTGVSARFRPAAPGHDALAEVRGQLPAVRSGYILYAGALDFRKNVDSLLVAYSRLPRTLRAEHQLVIVSRLSPPELDALRPRLRALDLAHDVVVANAVDDDDLVSLYQAARLFVFPSLYEGFGLPVAEAIACGTPTIASNTSSLVEIVGDESALFDPSDPESLRLTMERALTDPEISAGLARAVLDPRHTWPAVAERMIAGCRELAGAAPVESDGRRAAAIAALAAAEAAPWIEAARPGAPRGPARSAARALLWPLRRFFDPRFAGVDTHVTTMHSDLSARMDRAFGPWGSQTLTEMERSIARLAELIAADRDDLGSGARALGLGHVLTAIGRLPAGARILDVSSPPTGLAATLAALGYDVAVLASLPPDAPRFDAVIAVAANHGTRDLARFARPGGVLAVSLESSGNGDVEARLGAVLGPVEAPDVRLLRRLGEGAWAHVVPNGEPTGEVVALAIANRLPDPPGAAPAPQARVGAAPASDA